MRGLGARYTQILLDGQRVPPGPSLDSLNPEQIERIEILRAPTAETGARAIAGTINIVTREGFKKRLNDLRVGAGFEHGRVMPGGSWTRNDVVGPLVYNFSLSALHLDRDNLSVKLLDGDHSLVSGAELDVAQRNESDQSAVKTPGATCKAPASAWPSMRGTSGTCRRIGPRMRACAGKASSRAAKASAKRRSATAAACGRRCCMPCGSRTPRAGTRFASA